MQIAKDLLQFLDDPPIYVSFKLHYVLRDPSNLYCLRILVLKWSLPLKVRVIAFLYVLEHLPVFLVFVGQLPAQKAFELLVKLQIIHHANISEPLDLFGSCLHPAVAIMHQRLPEVSSVGRDRIGEEFLFLHKLKREDLLPFILLLPRVSLIHTCSLLLQCAKYL